MKRERILVVDDEPDMLTTCKKFLSRGNYEVSLAEKGADALDIFDEQPHDLVITDLKMPEMDGMEVLREIKKRSPETVVVMFTGFGTIQDAVTAMKEGAFDFITKPFTPDQLKVSIDRALRQHRLEAENQALKEQLEEKFQFDSIVGQSPAMQRVFGMIRKIADTQANVLITGGSGTGKELIARSIHANSSRKRSPFVPLNCGGLPEHLVESELFGHEKGAFTGAVTSRAGLMEHASAGTFFLDEISELPLNLQVKLLRVLEERKIRRVGSNRETEIDIRLISATNQDLESMVEEGTFREDLFYRVNTFVIRVPSLRERTDDVPLLADHFLRKYLTVGGKEISGFSSDSIEMLRRHDWPGNVRELQHVVERAVALASADRIRPEDLPETLGRERRRSLGDHRFHLPFKDAKEAVVEEFERAYIEHLLTTHGGNITRAAEQSGIDRRSLHRLLTKHQIDASIFSQPG
jgi:DNA-binding NtrC family response regulator